MIHNLIIRLRDNSPAEPSIRPEDLYQINIKGQIDSTLLDRFGVKALRLGENCEALIIAAFPGGPALRGFLNQLENLNLTVLSVEKIDQEDRRR
jgi:hypothetical protein